jgi:hypothetical protein
MRTIFADNINDLYLMSAILSNSVIFNVSNEDCGLCFNAAISINGERFMGSIYLRNLMENVNVCVKKLQFLSSITLNSNHEIEITTTDQVIACPVKSIDLSFSYDEEDLA